MGVIQDKLEAQISPLITLRNLIITLIILIILIVLWRNKYRIKKFFTPKAPNQGSEDQLEQEIVESRKYVIEILAGNLEKDINNTGWSHDYGLYSTALGLADNEIIYLAQYYRENLSPSESLYDAIGGEWYTWDWYYEEWPWELQARLADVGQR